MLNWRPFDYTNLDQMKADIAELGVHLPICEDLSILGTPLELYGKKIKNRLAIQPLEASDSFLDGAPTDLTFRRYRRFSAGGAGLIWFESVAVTEKSMTSPRELRITNENLDVFKRLLYEIRDYAADGEPPFLCVQLTHCSRGSRLDGGYFKREGGEPAYIAFPDDPYWPKPTGHLLTDKEIDEIADQYVEKAILLEKAGFDCIDIRACHGYFISELLRAFTRKDSIYGGPEFENRTRFLLNVIDRVKECTKLNFSIRLNATDLLPYPYGWGMKTDGSMEPDFTEPFRLAHILAEKGIKLMNITMGVNHATHILMPFNVAKAYPVRHQLAEMAFYQGLAKSFKEEFPDTLIMSGSLSWARQFSPYIAAGEINDGMYDLAGFGRMAYCYPEFANDILKKGALDPKKVCAGCQRCVGLINAAAPTGVPGGCPLRDKEIYLPLYKKYVTEEYQCNTPSPLYQFSDKMPPHRS